MIEISKTYHIALTEQQAKELYWCLQAAKEQHKLTVDDELVLVLNELKPFFDNGIRHTEPVNNYPHIYAPGTK
jgi:hypothetical protein